MNKEEWIEVLNSAYEKAQKDYQAAEPRTPEEYIALLCMSIFDYLSSSIASNKDAINIPIGDIFDASNYYNKTDKESNK